MMEVDGLFRRHLTITPEDNGAEASIIGLFLLVTSVLAVLMRLSLKWFRRMDRSSSEDISLMISVVFYIAQVVVLWIAVNHGLGDKSRSPYTDDFRLLQKLDYPLAMLYLWILFLTRYAVLHLLSQMAHSNFAYVWTCYGTMVIAGLSAVGGSLAVGFQCRTHGSWQAAADQCIDMRTFWLTMDGINLGSEVIVFLLPMWLVWDLNVAPRRKVAIVSAFGLRILVLAALAAKVAVLVHANPSSGDNPSLDSTNTNTAITSACVLASTVITACAPVLRPLLELFHSGLMGASLADSNSRSRKYGTYSLRSSGRRRGSYPLSNERKKITRKITDPECDAELRTVTVKGTARGSRIVEFEDNEGLLGQDLAIGRQTTVSVVHDASPTDDKPPRLS